MAKRVRATLNVSKDQAQGAQCPDLLAGTRTRVTIAPGGAMPQVKTEQKIELHNIRVV